MNGALTHSYEEGAVAALSAIRRRDVSIAELTSRFLTRIEDGNRWVRAIRHVAADQALEAARELDARRQAGDEDLPPLAGLPVVVKENCDTRGLACSAGFAFRADQVAATDSAITARLRSAGAIVLGVSVSDPGAFSVRTPDVTHPIDPELTVGGSSGGSAAALTAGFCLGAIGTDTGGSIRIPSACCGTVGLKPTFDALPTGGVFPLVPSLDHVGPMARSVADTRLLWEALSNQASRSVPRPRTIGVDPFWVEIADEPIRAAVSLALARLREQGISTVEVSLPLLPDVVSVHGRIFLVEAAAYHLAHYSEHIEAYPRLARTWFGEARKMSVAAYVDANVARAAMRRSVDALLGNVGAILVPTLAVSRPSVRAETVSIGGVEEDFTMGLVRLTCLFNHTGHPVVAFPVASAPDPLSASVQLVGPYGGEKLILDLAEILNPSTAAIPA